MAKKVLGSRQRGTGPDGWTHSCLLSSHGLPHKSASSPLGLSLFLWIHLPPLLYSHPTWYLRPASWPLPVFLSLKIKPNTSCCIPFQFPRQWGWDIHGWGYTFLPFFFKTICLKARWQLLSSLMVSKASVKPRPCYCFWASVGPFLLYKPKNKRRKKNNLSYLDQREKNVLSCLRWESHRENSLGKTGSGRKTAPGKGLMNLLRKSRVRSFHVS